MAKLMTTTYTPHGPQNRSALLAINYVYGNKSTAQVVTPNMSDMQNLSNAILLANGKSPLPRVYAPNEQASIVQALQISLGI